MELITKEFKHHSASEWIDLINKSINNIDASAVGWEIFPGLDAMPFASRDSVLSIPQTGLDLQAVDWRTGVVISDPDMFPLSEEAGVEAVFLDLNPGNIHNPENELLPKEIKWYIPHTLFDHSSKEMPEQKGFCSFLKTIKGAAIIDALNPFSYTEIRKMLLDDSNGFELVWRLKNAVNSEQKVGHFIDFVKELTNWIEKEKLSREDIAWLFDRLGVMVPVHNQFLFEKAFIRSIQHIWYNVQKDYDIQVQKLKISVLADNSHISSSLNDQLILNTTAVVIATISGAEAVFVSTGQFNEKRFENQMLARNIQLICKHESRLNAVQDALAGSYALEDLTAKLTNYIWSKL